MKEKTYSIFYATEYGATNKTWRVKVDYETAHAQMTELFEKQGAVAVRIVVD